ncbi:dTDP-D-glucose 4-6-dehydratase [Penicillium capsulatum]|uniref:dTDP-D-glucose 4-6-dehydratase n=1 Tax=Penicillium capsulatum TaxID=69766 RepID=A0A9W9LW17_9EURO|nr:dTDP-D-glucose 4-6-dehydratase [Penicillium capsulatum]KAJ6123281.1 dTDP-D-glucose 4-6-dehydratase [Penicillium capsulatum]
MPSVTGPGAIQLTGVGQHEPLQNVSNILITGGAGFIGSWLTRHLVAQYSHAYTVICLDRLDTVASLNNIKSLFSAPNFRFVPGNINDTRKVQSILDTYKIDCVIHFAASSHVQKSFVDPFIFTYDNVVGTHSLLEAMRRHQRITRFIHVSTDEVYGETNDHKVDEHGHFGPTNPYSASKAAAEMYVMAYRQSFGLPAIVVRSNNVYGPCQYPEKIIPTFTSLLIAGEKLTIQGDGLHTRCYLHGSDAADAFDTILHKGQIGETYNIESDYEVSNREVAARMLGLFGHDAVHDFDDYVQWIANRPFNDSCYRVDGSKLKQLGWRQRVDFPSGLAQTVEWYKGNVDTWWKKPAGHATTFQI